MVHTSLPLVICMLGSCGTGPFGKCQLHTMLFPSAACRYDSLLQLLRLKRDYVQQVHDPGGLLM